MMEIWKIFALGFVATVSAVDNQIDGNNTYNEYCDICDDHTLCKYEGLGKACEGSVDGGVTPEEIKYILDTHNWYRRVVAKGLETKGLNGSQPHASNMLKMEWDDELAKIAQHWADQCQFQHDTCRHDRRYKIGQNIYWNWRFPVLKTVNWTAAIASWFDEVEKFDPELVGAYEFNPENGHYTQMLWHDSAALGCGRRSYGPNKIYVCNYGPTGNWLNEPMYNVGEPCSECPENTRCDDGLCAIKPEIDPTSYEPLDEETGSVNLSPPTVDAVSMYNDNETETTEKEATTVNVTELPIHLNIIDNLDFLNDPDFIDEFKEIKEKIERLAEKIASKKLRKNRE